MAQLFFSVYGELFSIDLSDVMYFQADDHYTHVYLLSGLHFMIPFGLSKVEANIAATVTTDRYHHRMGRKYIFNMKSIFHVNVIKQVVQLADNHGAITNITLPKSVLRQIIDYFEQPESR